MYNFDDDVDILGILKKNLKELEILVSVNLEAVDLTTVK